MKPGHLILPFFAVLLNCGAKAQTYTWTNAAGGNWNSASNWNTNPNLPVFGADVVVDFSTLNLTANRELNLGTPAKTVGKIKFGDTTPSHSWDIIPQNGPLTLATTTGKPEIEVIGWQSLITVNIAGSQGFAKTGAATLRLNNTANAITGEILVSEGTLQIRDGSATLPGNVFAAATMNARSIRVTGTGILDLFRTAASTTTWSMPATTLENGGTLRFRATTAGTYNHSMAADLSIGAGGGTIRNNGGTGVQNITLSGALSGAAALAYAADASGTTRQLTVDSAANTFSGGWTVSHAGSGTAILRAGAANALGSGTVTLNANGRLLSGVDGSLNSLAAVTLDHPGAVLDLANQSWQNPSAALTVNNGAVQVGNGLLSVGTLAMSGGNLQVAVADEAALPVITAGNADFGGRSLTVALSVSPVGKEFELVRYAGALSNPPAVVFSPDTGRLTPVIDNGDGTDDAITLSFTGTVADLVWTGAESNVWDDNTTANFLNGASPDVFRTFDNVRFDDSSTVNTISLPGSINAGTVTFDHGTTAYTVGGAGALAGPAALVKSGSGTLTLNTNNTYTGTTTVSGGTLAINGNQVSATGAITVGGATSVLTGTGTVGGDIMVENGATFAPGGPASGTFTMSAGSSLEMKTGAVFRAHLDSSEVVSSKLILNGNVTIESGVSLDASDMAVTPATLPVDTKLVLVDYGPNSLQGTFSGLPEGAKLTIGANDFTIRYQDANRVTLTVTGEEDPYFAWAANPAFGLTPGVNDGFTQDADGDGLVNGLEWILGGNPSLQDAASRVTTTRPPGGGLVISFTREPDSIAIADLMVEYDGDLAAPWNSVAIGTSSSGPDANGVTVGIDTSGSPHQVTVTIPAGNEQAGKLFSRLVTVLK
jgi:autotransporter-associated beta strand protein